MRCDAVSCLVYLELVVFFFFSFSLSLSFWGSLGVLEGRGEADDALAFALSVHENSRLWESQEGCRSCILSSISADCMLEVERMQGW